ncbi:MAG: SLC13 family permease, partial [Candidatus Bipolaricaulota bacterium]
ILSYTGKVQEGVQNSSWEESEFGKTLLLGVAYACSIGGIGTLIGTPPNALLAGYMESHFETSISFLDWLVIGLPIVLILTPLAWLYLTEVAGKVKGTAIPGGKELIQQKLAELGPMNRGEKSVLTVFLITAFLWITRGFIISPFLPMIGDATVGMLAAVSLFLIPVNKSEGEFALDWEWALKIPWGTLILFGGGLALAEGIQTTGLDSWLAGSLTWLGSSPLIVVLSATVLLLVSLTHVTSNTATTAMMLPVLASFATTFGFDFLSIAVPAVISVSCAFMLPVATPPNAVVFGTGYVRVPDMVKKGFGLNVLAIILVIILGYFFLGPLAGIVF